MAPLATRGPPWSCLRRRELSGVCDGIGGWTMAGWVLEDGRLFQWGWIRGNVFLHVFVFLLRSPTATSSTLCGIPCRRLVVAARPRVIHDRGQSSPRQEEAQGGIQARKSCAVAVDDGWCIAMYMLRENALPCIFPARRAGHARGQRAGRSGGPPWPDPTLSPQAAAPRPLPLSPFRNIAPWAGECRPRGGMALHGPVGP